jgi:putative oxidoreductase
MLIQTDLAKLLLRVTLAVLLLFHGVHKLIYGIGGVKSLVLSHGLPEFLAYGVYLGELIAPIFILLGLYGRFASGVVVINMLMAIYLAYGFSWVLGSHGGLAWETPLLYLVMAISIIFLGSGKYAVNSK